ncbi:zinc finger MYM-type protein 1-like [Schistocerca nitens]|uniref:zinc finger MYM-type protein 1-like n=1 Tax=Schistocerca nitens TaxID=7011 RepID=UPI0021187FE8|nr:zinc finger MYM-type protein 1-like [Schistocerca nitens]
MPFVYKEEERSERTETYYDPYDIGRAVKGALRDDEKLRFLKNIWKPSANFSFPTQLEGKQNRRFKHEWMSQYNWLSYSKMLRGGFCTPCVLFSPSGAGIGSQVLITAFDYSKQLKPLTGLVKNALKTLVKEPLVKYKKATEDLRHHENTKYHKFSMEKALEFTKCMESSKKSIAVVLDTKKSSVIEENRHRDHGLIPQLKEEKTDDLLEGKHGVFESLLAFRMDAGDEDLKHHFSTCGRNSSMISNTVQNEVIHCIGDPIRSSISRDVKKAKFFSIICDETTDVTTKEQMTFCVRYIDIETFVTKEDFLGFTELKSATGTSIAEAIDEELKTLGLRYQYLCGQGYDGGSNMAGGFKGVQALILSKQPLAIYTHCFSHSLNLCISKSCDTPIVRNMMGIVGSVSAFLSASANGKSSLEEIISRLSFTESKKTKLKAMCPTIWVDRHDTLITFKELFVPVVTLLDELSSSRETNAETASKACMFSSAVRRGDFVVALATAAYCFSLTVRLSEQLQSSKMDLTTALYHVNDVLEVFNNIRTDSEIEFGSIFKAAVKQAEDIGSVIAMPRTISTQTKRDNVPASNAEEYFRRTVFLPVVDRFIAELETRFPQDFRTILPLEGLIPAHCLKYSEDEVIQASEKYEQFLESSSLLMKGELKLWRKNTSERSFSTLRRIKTYLRNIVGQVRLNGLALAIIHKERDMDIENLIDIFSKKKQRRMSMINWAEDGNIQKLSKEEVFMSTAFRTASQSAIIKHGKHASQTGYASLQNICNEFVPNYLALYEIVHFIATQHFVIFLAALNKVQKM